MHFAFNAIRFDLIKDLLLTSVFPHHYQ